ncbi:MAG: biotin/lipoyl-binding protein [Propionibacteriaceae bacterium]|nr:biotin/lipoyl-binding protein [Propionibacteriaceae bacterium]
MKLKVTVNQIPYEVEVEVDRTPAGLPPVFIGGGQGGPAVPVHQAGKDVIAPLAGSVRKILVEKGTAVKEGQVVAILEAMKMETEITSSYTGRVSAVKVEVGAAVQGGDPIMEIEPS